MHVLMIARLSADGFIARDRENGEYAVGIQDMDFFLEKTKEVGTVIMGLNTYREMTRKLDGRLTIVMSSSPDVTEGEPGSVEFFSGEAEDLLKNLEDRDIDQVVVVGGGQVNASFLVPGLVDELYLTVIPQLFGHGVNLSSDFDLQTRLRLLELKQLEDDSVLLHYEVVK